MVTKLLVEPRWTAQVNNRFVVIVLICLYLTDSVLLIYCFLMVRPEVLAKVSHIPHSLNLVLQLQL
jgi:hypothetical protein